MKAVKSYIIIIGLLCLQMLFIQTAIGSNVSVSQQIQSDKIRFLVISSYHREYAWSQETNAGLSSAMLELGYLDNQQQVKEYTSKDYVESSRSIVKKMWMDTKRKKSKKERAEMAAEIYKLALSYNPDLIFLGDDNAARYIGNQFLDSKIPVVFWGVNNTPVKYGLVDTIESPGHNVTGVYQPGYFFESLEFLKAIVPQARTFAILSDASTSGRNHVKKIEHLARKHKLPIELTSVVSTNDFAEWKNQVLKLQDSVDAFFLAQYSGMVDGSGKSIPAEKVAGWYLKNVRIPEAVGQGQFVKQGMLCGADDSGYNQGYEAVLIAHDILTTEIAPASYSPRPPKRGPLLLNKQRARMLGIKPMPEMGIEKYVEKISVLKPESDPPVKSFKKKKFLIVDSYHSEYSWSQDTGKGFCDAMLQLGYFDSKLQITEFDKNDYLETSTSTVKRLWMDTKRKKSKDEKERASVAAYEVINKFNPDLVFLGDDNAVKYIGRQLLDRKIPVVFWGVNVTPVKYGLVESIDKPGHNITGIYQNGYYLESMQLLKSLDPSIKTFAILSDNSTTGRAHYKSIEYLHRQKKLPFELKEIVVTGSLSEWQQKAADLQTKVDAFFVSLFAALKDDNGNAVPEEKISEWYVEHIDIPEATVGTKVQYGLLCAASDLGYKQGYEAVLVADDVLRKGMNPASYPARSPERGPLMANTARARQLNINLTPEMGIEKYIE